VHLEYILTELLKNSFRATVENHARAKDRSMPLPPIQITLSPPPSSSSWQSTTGNNFFSIRIRDQGAGVSRQNMERIFSYAFTTVSDGPGDDGAGAGAMPGDHEEPFLGAITQRTMQTGMGTIAGLGYGLPMSKLYARYFGGSLEFKSLEGWGRLLHPRNRSRLNFNTRFRCLHQASMFRRSRRFSHLMYG
jgi:26S proteasome regulatory subunit T1